MPFHHRPRKRGLAEGIDIIDPSVFFGAREKSGPDRKTLQLCKQVARALAFALAGDCHDEILREVVVDSVVPSPDASHLLATVIPIVETDADIILERLRLRRSVLRAAVTAAIHRKRAPELSFCVGYIPEGQ